MTQVIERMTFTALRDTTVTFEQARCPNCKKLIATVSGDWEAVKVRCARCKEVVEARRG